MTQGHPFLTDVVQKYTNLSVRLTFCEMGVLYPVRFPRYANTKELTIQTNNKSFIETH